MRPLGGHRQRAQSNLTAIGLVPNGAKGEKTTVSYCVVSSLRRARPGARAWRADACARACMLVRTQEWSEGDSWYRVIGLQTGFFSEGEGPFRPRPSAGNVRGHLTTPRFVCAADHIAGATVTKDACVTHAWGPEAEWYGGPAAALAPHTLALQVLAVLHARERPLHLSHRH
jgi:hypothetical protein